MSHQARGDVGCDTVVDVEIVASAKLIFLGELHGTNEAPKFASDLSCNLARRGHSLLFAVEWPLDLQPTFDRFFEQPNGPQLDALLSHDFFRSPTPDGRTSEAMFALIHKLRELQSSGAAVEVVLFDQSHGKPLLNNQREQALADNLRELYGRAPVSAKIVVLTGNIHSRRVKGTPWSKEFESAAYRLKDLAPMSFELAYLDGSAWVCTAGGGCGANPFIGNAPSSSIGTVRAGLMPNPLNNSSDSHHGTFFVGSISASPPYSRLPKSAR